MTSKPFIIPGEDGVWLTDCLGVGRDFTSYEEAAQWTIDRMWKAINDQPIGLERGPYKWRMAMRADYQRLGLIWQEAGITAASPEEREVAMKHYQAGYEHAMLISKRLLTAIVKLRGFSLTPGRGWAWVGATIAAWVAGQDGSLETEQLDAYTSLERASRESEWAPSSK